MNTKPDPLVVTPKSGITALASETAPFIYFDGAATYGVSFGAIQIELAANVIVPTDDGNVRTDVIVTAHLRCSPNAAIGLREAIDKALELAKSIAAPTAVKAAKLN